MEIWDLYDKDGNVTGEKWERKFGNFREIPDGRYHLVSDILVQHADGSFLLTKRHTNKDVYPGFWEASAGGSAQQGENPLECAKRELFEETGMMSEEFELINRVFREPSHSLIYSYVAKVDCDKDSVVLQKGETTEYKWVDAAGLLEYARSDLAIKTNVERYKSFYDKIWVQLKIKYKIASKEDIDLLMGSRLEMLRVVNNLKDDYNFPEKLITASKEYFLTGGQTTILAFDEKKVIGCATISYIKVMPTFSHPTGKRAHLMNVYTKKEYQGQGIAFHMVSMLIEEAWNRGITEISLDATEAGHGLYEKLGFVDSDECMVLVKKD